MAPSRRRCQWLVATVITIATGIGPGAQVTDAPILATAAVDVREVRIGDRLTVAVSLEGPSAIAHARPIVGAVVGAFALVDLEAQPSRRTAGHWRQSWQLVLTTFEHGPQEIPRIVLQGEYEDGRPFSATTPDSFAISVAPPSATAADPLLPLSSVIDLPATVIEVAAKWLLWSVLLAAGIAAAVPAGTRLVRWQRRRDFWRRLISQAIALRHGPPAGNPRDRYTTAARLLRRGIGRLVDGADSLATTEMIIGIVALGPRGAKMGPALQEVMSHLDEVRFGGSVPDDGMRTRAFEEVVAMLRALRALSASVEGKAR